MTTHSLLYHKFKGAKFIWEKRSTLVDDYWPFDDQRQKMATFLNGPLSDFLFYNRQRAIPVAFAYSIVAKQLNADAIRFLFLGEQSNFNGPSMSYDWVNRINLITYQVHLGQVRLPLKLREPSSVIRLEDGPFWTFRKEIVLLEVPKLDVRFKVTEVWFKDYFKLKLPSLFPASSSLSKYGSDLDHLDGVLFKSN